MIILLQSLGNVGAKNLDHTEMVEKKSQARNSQKIKKERYCNKKKKCILSSTSIIEKLLIYKILPFFLKNVSSEYKPFFTL